MVEEKEEVTVEAVEFQWHFAERKFGSASGSPAERWVRLPHASANCLVTRLPLWESKPKKHPSYPGFCSQLVPNSETRRSALPTRHRRRCNDGRRVAHGGRTLYCGCAENGDENRIAGEATALRATGPPVTRVAPSIRNGCLLERLAVPSATEVGQTVLLIHLSGETRSGLILPWPNCLLWSV